MSERTPDMPINFARTQCMKYTCMTTGGGLQMRCQSLLIVYDLYFVFFRMYLATNCNRSIYLNVYYNRLYTNICMVNMNAV